MNQSKHLKPWGDDVHADFFNFRSKYCLPELRNDYEQFNEFRLFNAFKKEIIGNSFMEIACATGELYRYLHRYHPEYNYSGYDISQPAVKRARYRFPKALFKLCKPNLSDLLDLEEKPAIVWARDVVFHQPDPFEYLSGLMKISLEATFLRIRTRDKGETVIDPEISCQLHYGKWVPYIVLNVNEFIETVCRVIPVQKIIIVKSYVQLGGRNDRFLPKECYYNKTGTAETAVYILRSPSRGCKPDIRIFHKHDLHKGPKRVRFIKYLQKVFRFN